MFDLIKLMDPTNNQKLSTPQTPNIAATAPIPQPAYLYSQEPFYEPKKSKPFFKIFLSLSIIIVVLLALGTLAYFKYYKFTYLDSKYGFIITDQKDWCSIPQQEGVYYALATSDSSNCYGKAISTFSISPITDPKNTPNDMEAFKKLCSHTFFQEANVTLVDTSNITLNNLHGYLCIGEGKPVNVDKIYIFKQILLLNNSGRYDYSISISYPKGDSVEEEKVSRIFNSLSAE